VPLQISEIGLRLAVGEPPSGGLQASPGPRRPDEAEANISPAQMEEIVRACVADVLRTLRMSEER
jgi:hypothetical protein